MVAADIIRAWKDIEYRSDLSAEEQQLLPEHPAGEVELDRVDEVCPSTLSELLREHKLIV